MKSIIASFKNMQLFSFLIGLTWGAALGLILFCYLVPHGPKAIAMLRHYSRYMSGQVVIAEKNRQAFNEVYNANQASSTSHTGHSSNPYMMGQVTTEKQFLEEMIAHHEAAVLMAKQVLALPSLHRDVENLANAIISAQTEEITKMKVWMKEWKY